MINKIIIFFALISCSITLANGSSLNKINLEPLSTYDVAGYKNIFSEQNRGRWKQADREIKKISNPILMGHVLYQRYMHATAYTSNFTELKNWMKNYGDLPGAERIFDLAKRKNNGKISGMLQPMTATSYSFPAEKPLPPSKKNDGASKQLKITPKPQNKIYVKKRNPHPDINQFKNLINRYLNQHNASRAEKRLWAFIKRGLLSSIEIDNQLSRIANEYYLTNHDKKALALAQLASRSREKISQPDWIAGLAAWRLGDCSVAAWHFEQVSNSAVSGDWTAAAGAFWAARSYMVCHRPGEVSRMLKKSASFEKTFYGILASKQLGKRINFDWTVPEFTQTDYNEVRSLSNVHRAIALAQVGENPLADQELSIAWGRTRDSQHSALLRLASQLGLAATQLKIGRIEKQKQMVSLDSNIYPIPYITPDGGYTLDKALLFAMIRQESAFNSWAQSSVGARGLMQLMMGAAGDMSQNRRLQRIKLDDPRYNMYLGQKYMKTMLENFAGGDIFQSLIAYNAGPGNMQKWIKTTNFQDDPLLFIESIPALETRIYIERVVSNMWIYRMRLGQDTPTLEYVASGKWPIYTSQDNSQSASINIKKDEKHANRSD